MELPKCNNTHSTPIKYTYRHNIHVCTQHIHTHYNTIIFMYTYLSESTLHAAQAFIISQCGCFIVYVIHNKFQLLYHFKLVGDLHTLDKLWVLVVFDLFRPCILQRRVAR